MHIPGHHPPGALNAITDVPGVMCAHETIKNDRACTGVTILSPCEGDVFAFPIPAAIAVGNGYGKLAGALQVEELGTLESLIGLTNTLSVPAVMEGLIRHHLAHDPQRKSVNVLVGETNDGKLNDIQGLHVKPHHVERAIENLSRNVAEGDVGAGAGTVCFGFKGGIGTASRVVSKDVTGEGADFTLGALVQSNYGGELAIYGHPVPKPPAAASQDGSCMIIVITDAPLCARQLKRLAKRGLIGMTNTGSIMHNGSGDFCVAASNHPKNRHNREERGKDYYYLNDAQLNPFFEACAEAVQEALYNSMTMATGTADILPLIDNLPPGTYT
ncbi:MAG: P1 family peptidase [Defluviitaleaceae bacterium]|nr:P1 family peptidase [Defluviitaleaceae bacterium]